MHACSLFRSCRVVDCMLLIWAALSMSDWWTTQATRLQYTSTRTHTCTRTRTATTVDVKRQYVLESTYKIPLELTCERITEFSPCFSGCTASRAVAKIFFLSWGLPNWTNPLGRKFPKFRMGLQPCDNSRRLLVGSTRLCHFSYLL